MLSQTIAQFLINLENNLGARFGVKISNLKRNADSFLATNLLYGGGVVTYVNQVPPHQRLPKGNVHK